MMRFHLALSCLVLLAAWPTSLVLAVAPFDGPLTALLEQQIGLHAFPGAAAAVANRTHILYYAGVGNFTYGIPPPQTPKTVPAVTPNSLFDLASLTKVTVTTTATMVLYQHGLLDIHMRVCDPSLLGPDFANNGKDSITILNLLLHNAGFPPDPVPEYWSPEFNCPATSQPNVPEVFTCQQQVYNSLLAQTVVNPPGEVFVYSDLSMITMMYVIGTIVHTNNLVSSDSLNQACMGGSNSAYTPSKAQCYYEAYVRTKILPSAGMLNSSFLPPQSVWPNCLPTWNDTSGSSPGPGYRNHVIQGQVSDQNAYALGGIAGHAGLFAPLGDVLALGQRLMLATPQDGFINSTTVKLFTTMYNQTQSSRALGWDTNDYKMNDYRGCGNLSSTTFTHTGYTGTQICVDQVRQLIVVLLTNRVYPQASDESEDKIHTARQLFSNLVKDIYDNQTHVEQQPHLSFSA